MLVMKMMVYTDPKLLSTKSTMKMLQLIITVITKSFSDRNHSNLSKLLKMITLFLPILTITKEVILTIMVISNMKMVMQDGAKTVKM